MDYALLALAAALAWLLTWEATSKRPAAIAWTLSALLVIAHALPELVPHERAFLAVFTGWYAVTAACVAVVLDESAGSVQTIGLAFLLAVSLAVSPWRTGTARELETAAFVFALAVQLLATLRFLSRGKWPDDAQRVALILVASSVVDAVPGPWMLKDPAAGWDVGRWIAGATWLAVAGWEVRCLIRARAQRK